MKFIKDKSAGKKLEIPGHGHGHGHGGGDGHGHGHGHGGGGHDDGHGHGHGHDHAAEGDAEHFEHDHSLDEEITYNDLKSFINKMHPRKQVIDDKILNYNSYEDTPTSRKE